MKSLLVFIFASFIGYGCSCAQAIDLSKKVRDINKMVPMKVDEATTLIGASFIGKTLQYNFIVEDVYIPLIDQKEYKEKTLNNLVSSDSKLAFQYFITEGIGINHAVYDNKRNLQFIIEISTSDLKNAYKRCKR